VETQLDHTYLRPGIISRAAALGLAALGVGAGVLLACFGLSFFFQHDSPVVQRLDALTAKVETLVQRPDRLGDVIAKLDDLSSSISSKVDQINDASGRSSMASRLASIDERLEELKRRPPVISGDTGKGGTINGSVIEKEVTVFHTVQHDKGNVVTGWIYPDGASADQRPTSQYCYWSSEPLGGTTGKATVYIATDGTRLPNIASGVPRLGEAMQKCIWWNGAGQ
jgi:hypothetical protein